MSEYVYRATAAADRSSNSGSVTRSEINRDRIESLSAIDASMSLLQVASHRQPNAASSGPIDSRGGQQQLEQASSVFGASGPQFSRRPEAEQSQAHGAHRMTRREHIVQELQRIVILLVGNRSSSSSSPERQNTSASPRRQNTLTGSVVISQNNSFASAAVPSGSLSAVTASAPGDGTTGRQDSIISTTTSTSAPAAVISHQKLPFSMERLLIETASALQKELLMLHPGRPRDLYDNKGGGVHHNQRGGPRRPPRSSRSSAGATTEALLDRSRSLRGHAECYDNVSGGLSSSYASALRHPELLTNNSSQLGGGAVGRTVSFASNDSSLGSGSGSALTSFEDTVAGASGGGAPGTSRKQNRSFAEFPKVQQQELIAPYRQDVRQVIENMLAPLKSKTGGGGSGGKSEKSTGLSERSGLVQQPSMTTLLTKRSSFTSAAWEELSSHEPHQHFADHIDDFPYFRQYEPRGSFPEPAKYAPLGHASRGPSNATAATASPAASPRPSSRGISVLKRSVLGGNEGKSPANASSTHHRKDSTPAGGREELREEQTSKESDTTKGKKRTNPFSNAVRQLYRWNHEIIQEERLAARTVAEATSSMSPFRLLLHRGEEEDNHHHRDFSRDRLGDSTTSAMIDGQTPTVSPQLLAGSERGDENPFAVPPLRTSAISRSSSSVLSMPPEAPTMEAVFVEEVRVASHAFGLLDGAEDDALFSEVSSPQGSLTGESFVGGNGRGTGGSRNVAAQRKLFFPLSSTMLQPLISSVDAAAASSSSEGASYPPIPAHHLLPSASVGMLHPRLLDNVVQYLWHTALTYPQHPLRKALTWFVEQRLDYLTSAMRVAGIRVADVQWDSAVANPFDVSDLIGQSLAVSSRLSSKVNRQTTTTSAAAPNDRQEIHRFYSFPNGAKGMWETDRVAFVAALSETFAEKMFVARSIPVTMDLPDPWSNLSPLSTSYSVAAACAAVLVEERDRALILLKGSTNSISYSLTSRLTLTNDKNATSSSGGDKAPLEDAGKAVAALRSSIASKFTSLKSTLRRARSNSSLLSESKPSLTTSGSTTVNSARTYQDFVLVRPSGAAVVNHRSRSPSPTDPDGDGDLDEIDDDDLPTNPGGPRAGEGALTIHSLESSTRASVTSATATTTTLLENDVILPGSNQLGASPLGGCVLSVSIAPVFRETVPASLDGLLYWLILDAVLCLHFGSRQVRDDVLLAAASTAIDAKNADDRPLMYKFRNGVRIYALLDDVISTAESHQPTTTTPVGAEPVVKTLCVTDAGLAMLTGLALELDRFVEAWITRVLSYASPSQPSTGVKPPFATAATTTDQGGFEPPNWVNPDSETERLISFLQHTFQFVEHVATYSTIEFRFRRSLPPSSSALIDGESSKGKEDEVERQLSGPLHSDDEMERQMQHQNRSHDAVGADVLLPVAVCLCSRLKWKHVLLPVMQWIDGTPWYASPVGGKGASAYTYMTFTAALSAAISASSDDYN